VLIGALIMGVSFIIMWQLFLDNGVDYNFVYFFSHLPRIFTGIYMGIH
jgi:hypothetical protein